MHLVTAILAIRDLHEKQYSMRSRFVMNVIFGFLV